MELIRYADAELMMIDLAQRLAGELRQALAGNETVSLAVPGGTTPGPIFDSLCAADLDWDRVTVLPTDERWVPDWSDRSNARLIRQRLLTGRAAAATFLPLYAEAPDAATGAAQAAERVAAVLPLSIALLGMGEDMHTASMFPGADGLAAALSGEAPVVAIAAEGIPEPRLTLSAPVLAGAISRHLVIVGEAKLAALESARGLPPEDAPVAAILPGTLVHWAAN